MTGRRPARLLTAVVGLALVGTAAGCGTFGAGSDQKTLSAMFDRAVVCTWRATYASWASGSVK